MRAYRGLSRAGFAAVKIIEISDGFPGYDDIDTYRNTTAWFSPLPPSLDQALPARSSASPMALPNFPPSGPFADDV